MSRDRIHDVAIIGTGLIGAIYARLLLEAGLDVVMFDAGAMASARPGEHLFNSYHRRRDPHQRFQAVEAWLRPVSLPVRPPRSTEESRESPARLPDSHDFTPYNPIQDPATNLPAAATCHAVGGAGIVWSCLAPRLDRDYEPWDLLPAEEWGVWYARAEALLHVSADTTMQSSLQRVVSSYLQTGSGPLSGRAVRPAPLAARRAPQEESSLHWTGPADVLGPYAEAGTRRNLLILPEHVARRLVWSGNAVQCVEVESLETHRIERISARWYVIAAGPIHTPQLLWCSRIHHDAEHALGRYLTDHPLAFGRVSLSPALVARVLDESALPNLPGHVMVPFAPGRPHVAFILQDKMDLRRYGGTVDSRFTVNLYAYSLCPPREENRVWFTPDHLDVNGLPKPTFIYSLNEAEKRQAKAMVDDLQEIGTRLGSFLPGSPPQLLSPGSSMHLMGTARAGPDDGRHVTDSFGRIHGFSNLFAGGTSLVACPTASCPTLAVAALAVRSAHYILNFGTPPSGGDSPGTIPLRGEPRAPNVR